MSDNKQLHIAILEYLQNLSKNPGGLDADSIEVAVQCLAESLGIDLYDDATKQHFLANKATTLPEIFEKGLNPSTNNGEEAEQTKKTLADITEEEKKQAEEYKNKGNAALGNNPEEAIEFYTMAISLNPFNHIYLNNRAVAKCKIEDYQGAVKDAKASIKLNEQYSKSHYRLGLAYDALGKHQDAQAAYQTAKRVAQRAGETSMINAIDESIKSSKAKANPRPAGGANGMPDLSSMMGGMDLGALAGMFGGAGGQGGAGGLDLGALMNNPMVQNIMSNPAMMSNIQNMMGGMMGGGAQNQMGDDEEDDYYSEDDEQQQQQ